MSIDIHTSAAASLSERRSQWLALISVVLAVVGLALSTPPLMGPDEGAHQATASYLTVQVLPPKAETREYVDGLFVYGDCVFGFDSTVDAGCTPGREAVMPAKERILNYPPPYYWFVGLGQKFAPGADTWMDVGGRIASSVLNIGALVLLGVLLHRRVRGWGATILAVSTPMASFLWAVVNPNGWEITSGMLFAYFFARAWWSSEVLGRYRRPWVPVVTVLVSGLAFALSRHDAILWMSLLMLAIVMMGGRVSGELGGRAVALAAAGIGFAAGVLWQLAYPAQHTDNNPDRVLDPTWVDRLRWLGQIDEVLPDRLRQMVGVLGWLDTPVPQTLVVLLLLGWGAVLGFLYARIRIPATVLVLGFIGTALVPTVLEGLRWNDWPYWYQGRITLSFTIPFLFILLLRYGGAGVRAVTVLSIANSFVLAFMVWTNLMRYSFGVLDYLPLRWADPAIDAPMFWGTLLCVVAIVVIAAVRSGWLVAERKRDVQEMTSP